MPSSRSDSGPLSLALILIRVALAVVFIFAGWNKFFGEFKVRGEAAATLANLRLIAPPPSAAPPAPPEAPSKPLPSPSGAAPGSPHLRSTVALASIATLAQSGAPATSIPVTARAFTASDFPDEVPVRALWGIALAVHAGAHPGPSTSGNALPALWPRFLADGPFPRLLAVSVAVTELLGGILVLVGWLTRLAGLALAGVMLGAMWLTQIGPNWQTGNVVLGFIPNHPAGDPAAWTPLLFQFTLFCAAMSLLFGGSGRLAIDWAIGSSPAPSRPPAQPASGRAGA